MIEWLIRTSMEQRVIVLLAAVGLLGGVLRDLAPGPEEIWRFTPFFDLNLYRFFKERYNHRRTVFALEFTAPLWVAVLAPFLLGEKLTLMRILAAVIGFIALAGIIVQ